MVTRVPNRQKVAVDTPPKGHGPSCRYRVVREPNPRDDHYEARDREVWLPSAPARPTVVTQKRLDQLTLRAVWGTARVEALPCFRKLVNESKRRRQIAADRRSHWAGHCNRLMVTVLLLRLRSAQPPVPRDQLKAGASALRRLAQTVLDIELSAHRLLVDPDGQFQNLSTILRVYAERLDLLVQDPLGTSRALLEFNLTLAALLRHVKQTTGGWRDEDVQELVRATTGKTYDLKDWRKHHRSLLRNPTAIELAWARVPERRREEARAIWANRRRRGGKGASCYLTDALQAARELRPDLFQGRRPTARPVSDRALADESPKVTDDARGRGR